MTWSSLAKLITAIVLWLILLSVTFSRLNIEYGFILASIISLMFFSLVVALIKNKPLLYIASLMSNIGILGTFLGITYGLLGFNPSDIQASVPQLLAGMKTAFITSILGLTFNILIKIALLFQEE